MKLKTKATRPAKTRSERPDGGDAFVPETPRSHTRLIDDEAESLGEEFIAEVTSGEHVGEDARDEGSSEEELFGSYVPPDFDDEDAVSPD